jgi:hypothetical protein
MILKTITVVAIMLYETERDLQKDLATIEFNFDKSYPVSFMRREVRVGGCIPDLVMINFKQDPANLSWPCKWNFRHSFVIWLLRRHQELSSEEIARSFFSKVEQTIPIVRDLVASNILVENINGSFSLALDVANLASLVIAVEAKLKDWRGALSQAISYKEFANITFVAMDATKAPRSTEVLNKFKTKEVGICAVSLGSIEWLVYPPTRFDDIGHQKEYLAMSATIPTTQIFWSSRNRRSASSQA